jgi:hypothetical protein
MISDDPTYKTYYGGFEIKEKERHYVCCRSGLDYHWSTVNHSDIPRLALSFGFFIPREDLDRIVKPLPESFEKQYRLYSLYAYLIFRFLVETIQTTGEYLFYTILYLIKPDYQLEDILHEKEESAYG